MLKVKVTTNFASIPFPSGKELLRELARNTRPTIAKRLEERAKMKIGTRQKSVRGRLSGLAVEGWAIPRFGVHLFKTGRIIRDRIRARVEGQDILFGVTGNARYGRIQKAHEFGASIPITEAMRQNRFHLKGAWRRLRGDTPGPIHIPARSYIRGTVYAHELWMMDEIIKAMKRSMKPLGRR